MEFNDFKPGILFQFQHEGWIVFVISVFHLQKLNVVHFTGLICGRYLQIRNWHVDKTIYKNCRVFNKEII